MKPWTLAPGLALLLAAQAEAAGTDYLKLVYADGVFRSSEPIPSSWLSESERGFFLVPNAYGGDWRVTLDGASAPALARKVHLTFMGGAKALSNAPTIGKLMARLSVTAARSCFSIGAERLPALKSWVEESVKQFSGKELNTERTFGVLRLQLLAKHSDPQAGVPDGQFEVDVLMTRSGTPGAGGWTQVCSKG